MSRMMPTVISYSSTIRAWVAEGFETDSKDMFKWRTGSDTKKRVTLPAEDEDIYEDFRLQSDSFYMKMNASMNA